MDGEPIRLVLSQADYDQLIEALNESPKVLPRLADFLADDSLTLGEITVKCQSDSSYVYFGFGDKTAKCPAGHMIDRGGELFTAIPR